MSTRLRIDLAYDGARFHGWARQPGLRTVQEHVEAALVLVLRTPGLRVVCAGRTDTGVSARAQTVHVDVPDDALDQPDPGGARTRKPTVANVARRLNGVLDDDVRVRAVREVTTDFDARFSALWRRYAYRIADREGSVDPLRRGEVVAWPRPLDERRMNEAAAILAGRHDFASFCKKREGATTIRSLLDLSWERETEGLLVATVRADAFCHNMVRALIGCMVSVGEGRRDPDWARVVLTGRERHPSVRVMKPHGLTLEEVAYPADDELAARAAHTRAVRTDEDLEDA